MVWHFQQTINTTGRARRVCSGQYNWWLKEAPMARSDTGISLLALLAISTDREVGIKIEISSLIKGNCEEHEEITHHGEPVKVLQFSHIACSTFQLKGVMQNYFMFFDLWGTPGGCLLNIFCCSPYVLIVNSNPSTSALVPFSIFTLVI